MAGARKFGTFGGVFTPSIMTIVGVILYMRLASIIGQAGLMQTLLIIAIAHVISITTGLSVASVATDKKLRGGGTYYMLSRSLGLPIGGTLGIALFVGLSLAVSLYVIGFTESLLRFRGIEPTLDAIRSTGIIVLILLTVVTFISTSLAMRAQYFIMALMAISLISVVLGVGRHDLAPTSAVPLTTEMPAAVPLIVLFGIFFPAVTGFEAGVSMSGDLRDPRRSIPFGTIAAILTGLAIYIAMSFFLARTVDPVQLATNPNILEDISLVPQIVLLGIWGATLSSGLGNILAAPRILQATAVDRITPTFFGRGYGPSNEPRHALLLTFVIAFGGVMIGELDVIARVVSMFFITAYGFLNITAAIESWASPDFRPSFRVPRLVPVIGALACFIVMIQLDFMAMLAATLVLAGLYAFQARRQLQLETGDAWSGFWASVARAALHRLDRSGEHRRNWRPNMLAFALPESPREPLLELGRQLAGRRGMLTAIDVVPGPEDVGGVLRTASGAERDAYGVFTRAVQCRDAYTCVADVARYHGFAGVEHNALVLPWPQSPDARFADLLGELAELDQNVLILSASSQKPGPQPRVDVWWSGDPQHAGLQLSLVRALVSADPWRGARFRVIAAGESETGGNAGLSRQMAAVLQEMRIDAAVHIARARGRERTLDELVLDESADADLVLFDASALRTQAAVFDLERAQVLSAGLRATIFALPSSFFSGNARRPARVVAARTAAQLEHSTHTSPTSRVVPALRLPGDATIASAITDIRTSLDLAVTETVDGLVRDAYGPSHRLIERAAELVAHTFQTLIDADPRQRARTARVLRGVYGDLVFQSQRLFEEQRTHILPKQTAALFGFSDGLIEKLETLPDAFDATLIVERPRRLFDATDDEGAGPRVYKFARRLGSFGRNSVRLEIPLVALLRRHLSESLPAVERAQRDFVVNATAAANDAQKLLGAARHALERVQARVDAGDDVRELAAAELARLQAESASLTQRHRAVATRVRSDAARGVRQVVHRLARDVERVDAAVRVRLSSAHERAADAITERTRTLPDAWRGAQSLLLTSAEIEFALVALRNRAGTIEDRARDRLRLHVHDRLLARLHAVRSALHAYMERAAVDRNAEFTRMFGSWPEFDGDTAIEELLVELRTATAELPEQVEILSPVTANRLAQGQLEDQEIVAVALRPLVDYQIDNTFLGPLKAQLVRLAAAWARATDAAQDAVRLAAFQLRDPDADGDDLAPMTGVLANALKRIDAGRLEVESVLDELDRVMPAHLERAMAALDPYGLHQETGRLPRYVRARRGRQAVSWFQERRRDVQRVASDVTTRLTYQRSEAIRFARELETRARSSGGALIELVADVSPDPRVLENLPYHYRQLFLGKPGSGRDYWGGRSVERKLAAQAAELYRRGFKAPILVVGEPLAGKSALAHTIANDQFEGATVYRVTPPRERTSKAEALLQRTAQAVGAPAGTDDPLLMVPTGSVVVLEDLDRWWERSDSGYDAIEAAFELMERHADRCVFLVTADVHAFRFIDRVRPMRRRFLSVIECRPFSAREVGEVLETRHGSTGMTFVVDGVSEDRMTDVARARLHHRLFEYSGGNIGAALHGWIANITAIDGDRLILARPERPDLQPLDELEPLQKLVLVQLLLHRAMSATRLLELSGSASEQIESALTYLRRTRVIVEDPRAGLVINPFLRPFVARRFSELELLG